MHPVAALAVLLSLSGCSLLLGDSPNEELQPRLDASADIDGAPSACQRQTFRAPLVDDTMISGEAVDQPHDNYPNLTISDDLESVGLLRFDLEGIPAGVQVLDAILTLPHASQSDECGGACGSCEDITRSGEFAIYIGTNDWSAGVTWNQRGDGRPWDEPGAKSERQLLDTFPYLKNQTVVFEFPIESAGIALESELTLMVDATDQEPLPDGSQTKMVLSTRENECGDSASFSELVLEHCPP